MGEKNFSPFFFMLLLVEGEEKECLPKFGVPIFILAHKLNKFYSLSWKHCTCNVLVLEWANELLKQFLAVFSKCGTSQKKNSSHEQQL